MRLLRRIPYKGARPSRPLYLSLGNAVRQAGGEGGIRTHVAVSRKHAFQACSFSHSDTSPRSVALVKYNIAGRW
jgi:hypothetical protein